MGNAEDILTASFDIPEDTWEWADSETKDRGHASFEINGLRMHLLAIAVETVNGRQGAMDAEDDRQLDEFWVATGHEGHFETVEIGEKDYVFFASPYG